MGEDGATTVHRVLVRRTMRWMDFPLKDGIEVEIRYAGDDLEGLRLLCGDVAGRVSFRPQQEGDLGRRLSDAFSTAFREGASQVAIVGTDCPQLSENLVFSAFAALNVKDVVLGPATDGGYYLIASRRYCPGLFTDISWGGNNVLDDTLSRANRARLTVELLTPLADVDRAEDVNLILCDD
jgi:rSAM/selenodomain-associated transferase 1